VGSGVGQSLTQVDADRLRQHVNASNTESLPPATYLPKLTNLVNLKLTAVDDVLIVSFKEL
jgi:hypothetical protein